MPAPPNPPFNLERRLEKSAIAFLKTNALLRNYDMRESADDAPLIPQAPEGEPRDLKPVFIVKAEDRARHKITIIREIDLSVTLRCNSGVPTGDRDDMSTIMANLEFLVDSTNLKTGLTSPALGIQVMLAVRKSGVTSKDTNLVRERTYGFDTRCVLQELTTP